MPVRTRPCRMPVAVMVAVTCVWSSGSARAQTLADLVRAAAPPPVTEQEWMTLDVLRGVAALVHFGNTGQLPAAGDITVMLAPSPPDPRTGAEMQRVIVAGRTLRTPLRVVDHVWSSATYAPIARELLRADLRPGSDVLPLSAGTSGTAWDIDAGEVLLLAGLLEPRVQTLLDWNQRVSAALRANARSFSAHEQAALLVGVLALREGAGVFSDPRRYYARMAAHLSVADVVRGTAPPTLAGALARILVSIGAGRQREAIEGLEAIEARVSAPPISAWIRALRLCTTGDWRLVSNPSSATLLERLALARAVRSRLGDAALLDLLDRVGREPMADWSRIALDEGFGVETGQRFAEGAIALELDEAREVWTRLQGGVAPGRAGLVARLNDPPAVASVPVAAPGARVLVLDWGLWAQAAQRHLCARVSDNAFRLRSQVAQAAEADAFEERAYDSYGSLTLFPVVRALQPGGSQQHRRAMEAVNGLCRTRPDLVTTSVWRRLGRAGARESGAPSIAPETAWFRPSLPAGTLFDIGPRLLDADSPARPTPEQVARFRELAPFHYGIAWEHAWHRYRGRPSPDQADGAFAPFLSYDAAALMALDDLLTAHLPERTRAARQLCEIATDRCDVLAVALLDAGRDEEAAAVFQRWADRARSTVRVANGIRWLVHYYVDTGRRQQALATASRSARTRASEALGTMAEVLERAGRVREAREYCRQAWDRYDAIGVALVACALRLSLEDSDGVLQGKVSTWVGRTFPRGLERYGTDDPQGQPDEGVIVKETGPRAERLGLRRDDVVVGVDGYRVGSYAQFAVVSRLKFDARLPLVVWRDGRYERIELNAPQRWLSAALSDYRAPGIASAALP